MKWEKHGDVMRAVDRKGRVRAFLWLECGEYGVEWSAVYTFGGPLRVASGKSKRKLMTEVAQEVRRWGYR